MRYIYFKGPQGNFGDDLNSWLWPLIFGQSVDFKTNKLFYGIGTILSKSTKLVNENSTIPKIVFGTGVRPSFDPIVLNDSWDVKFVRGPLSSMTLGGGVEFVSDSAYAIRQLDSFEQFKNSPKRYEVSIMPHIYSTNKVDWPSICKKLKMNYISPHSEDGVEHTIKEIASSRYLITEAMHGAIMADALRVPWKRFILFAQLEEGIMVSEFKWMDWLFSVQMPPAKSIHINLFKMSRLQSIIKKISFGTVDVKLYLLKLIERDLIHELSKISISDFFLSKDNVLEEIDRRIEEKITQLRSEMQ